MVLYGDAANLPARLHDGCPSALPDPRDHNTVAAVYLGRLPPHRHAAHFRSEASLLSFSLSLSLVYLGRLPPHHDAAHFRSPASALNLLVYEA